MQDGQVKDLMSQSSVNKMKLVKWRLELVMLVVLWSCLNVKIYSDQSLALGCYQWLRSLIFYVSMRLYIFYVSMRLYVSMQNSATKDSHQCTTCDKCACKEDIWLGRQAWSLSCIWCILDPSLPHRNVPSEDVESDLQKMKQVRPE